MRNLVAFIYDDSLSSHVLREGHPMKPVRLKYTYDLLRSYGAFDQSGQIVKPRHATLDELTTFHTRSYVDAVERFGVNGDGPDMGRYNFTDIGDNPVYPGMFDAARLSTGGSLVAAELVASGSVNTAFNIGGGLHHAAADHASGFCIFNDPVIAIKYLVSKGMRVAYVDIDAHHGDGVQNAFYETDQVLTISTHESGQFLFPGTGFVDEIGTGQGRGYAVNVPLFPYTGDETYLDVFDQVVLPLVKAFNPDVLVSQLGIDTHFNDPITHLRLSSRAFTKAVSSLAGLGMPWIALGGGGYDVQAVARCWTLAYGEMGNKAWPNSIPTSYSDIHGQTELRDEDVAHPNKEIRDQIASHTQSIMADIKRLIFPFYS